MFAVTSTETLGSIVVCSSTRQPKGKLHMRSVREHCVKHHGGSGMRQAKQNSTGGVSGSIVVGPGK